MADSVQDGTRMNSLIHRAVRRDLDDFARALDSFPAGDRERATALAARFQWFDTLLTHHHEGEEEILWPVLRTSPPNTEEVGELTDEHERIVAALSAARAAFATVRRQRDRRGCGNRGIRRQGTARGSNRALHARGERDRRTLLAGRSGRAEGGLQEAGSERRSARGAVVHAVGVRRRVGGRQGLSPDADPAARALDLEDGRRTQLRHIHCADSGVVLSSRSRRMNRARS